MKTDRNAIIWLTFMFASIFVAITSCGTLTYIESKHETDIAYAGIKYFTKGRVQEETHIVGSSVYVGMGIAVGNSSGYTSNAWSIVSDRLWSIGFREKDITGINENDLVNTAIVSVYPDDKNSFLNGYIVRIVFAMKNALTGETICDYRCDGLGNNIPAAYENAVERAMTYILEGTDIYSDWNLKKYNGYNAPDGSDL